MPEPGAPYLSGMSGEPTIQSKNAVVGGKAVSSRAGWFQRLGAAGFAFFFIKGLLWLALPGLIGYLGCG